jgi:16S rRNA (guanine527-N7)-methyltransferase
LNQKLIFYASLVQKFNPKLNLVSKADLPAFHQRHISDGIESLRIFMDIYDNSIGYSGYDLGSGNGVPGIVWCILNPSLNLILVEIDSRKAEFLKHCLRELDLPNCSVVCTSVSDINLSPNDFFICRAFRNIDKLFLEFPPLLNHSGFLLKGSTWNNEVRGMNESQFSSYSYFTESGVHRNLVHYSPKKILQ